MKIGILTFHRAINYGAVLQCYALYTTLQNMGHDVEIIDYRPETIERYRNIFRKKDFYNKPNVLAKIKYIISCITLIWSKKKTNKKFDNFLCNHLKFSPTINNSHEITNHYDIIFFGSDQIWSPTICEGLDEIYYGQFEKGNTKFVSYAASIGNLEQLNHELRESFGRYILSYDSISVRENVLSNYIKQNFNIDTTVVCDPSLLLKKSDYEKMLVKPEETNYVAFFNLERSKRAEIFAQGIAQKLNSEVIKLGANINPLHKKTCKQKTNLSPAEFLGYLYYAKCVVTDSFHATSFSIILHKDFYTTQKISNNERAKTILNVAGLSDRFVNSNDNIEFTNIDYTYVDERLEKYRKSSMSFINKSLETDTL